MTARNALALGSILTLVACGEESKPAPATVKQPPAAAAKPALKADVPTVDATLAPHALQGPMVVVTGEAIVFDGKSLVRLEGGQVTAADKESGPRGLRIPKLAALMKATPGTTFHIAAVPTARYDTLTAIVVTAGGAGYKRPLILVNTEAGPGDLAVSVPERAAASSAGGLDMQITEVKKGKPIPAPPPEAPAQLIVSITGDKLLLWSVSGLEGTVQAPALELPVSGGAVDLAKLRSALEAIALRRWPAERPPGTDEIVVQASPAVTMKTVAPVIAAVQARVDGRPLFPVTLLALGFE